MCGAEGREALPVPFVLYAEGSGTFQPRPSPGSKWEQGLSSAQLGETKQDCFIPVMTQA